MTRVRVTAPSRPLLRWHGGKWMLAPWIVQHMPEHRIYVEPFGGAASVLLRKPRSYAEIYNDLDGDVVNLFRLLRSDRAGELVRQVELTPFARVEFQEAYGDTEDPVERARRTIARSFMGFSGGGAAGRSTGFRADSNRSGTTPARDWRHYPESLAAVVERLRGVVIENRPALDVIAKHDRPDALFYVDPPYVAETRGVGSKLIYRHELSDADHAQLLDALDRVQGHVILSGYDCPLYDALDGGRWHRRQRETFGDGALPRTEVIWMNFDPETKRRHAAPLRDGLFG